MKNEAEKKTLESLNKEVFQTLEAQEIAKLTGGKLVPKDDNCTYHDGHWHYDK